VNVSCNSNVSVAVEWAAVLGKHNVTVAVDPLNNVTEFNETNNNATVKINVTAEEFIDLTLNSSDIKFSEYPLKGRNLTINVTVHNIGTKSSNSSVVRILDNSTLMEETDMGNIPAGESKTTSLTWKWDSLGFHEINVIVDPYDSVNESNESNNNATTYVAVASKLPFLYITEHFVIHYEIAGKDAVNTADENNNSIPDFVEKVGDSFEKAYHYEVGELGYLSGEPIFPLIKLDDSWRYHVYMTDLDYDKGGSTEPWVKFYLDLPPSLIWINKDLSYPITGGGFGDFNSDGEADDTILLSTCGHEYYHAIQIKYLGGKDFWDLTHNPENLWAFEGTPAWMEYKLIRRYYPSISKGESDGLSLFFDDRTSTYQSYPNLGLEYYSDGNHYYEASLYWWFFENYKGINTIKSFWQKLDQTKEPISAINGITNNEFDGIFKTFTKANYFIDSWYPLDIRYTGEVSKQNIDLENLSNILFNIDKSWLKIQNYGALYFTITKTKPNARIKITFDNSDNEENFFLMAFPKGEENREITFSSSLELEVGDGEGTVVIVGRLGNDTGDGDFTIIFEDITPSSLDNTTEIQSNTTVQHKANVDSTAKEARFNLNWESGDLDFVLTSPNGTAITPQSAQNSSEINYTTGSKSKYYEIANPEKGEWTLNITSSSIATQNVITYVNLESNLTLSVSTDKSIYEPNQTISINGNLTKDGSPLTGATVKAKIIKSPGIDTVTLTNNGDGTYSRTYTNTSAEETYQINVIANGTVNNTQFYRESRSVVTVQRLPDMTIFLSDIVFSNSTPKAGETIQINATVYNTGNKEANVTVYIYDNTTKINETTAMVGANGANIVSTLWEITNSGTHVIKVELDPSNTITEKNESNNNANKTISVNPAMELRLTCLTDGINYALNQKVNITCYLYNFDWDSISGDSVSASVNGSNLILIENGTGYYACIFNQSNRLGVYEINVTAMKENYSNYTAHLSFEVIALPDLVPLNLTLSDQTPDDGEDVAVNATISNTGTGNAANVTVFVYAGTTLIENQTVSQLPINGSQIISANWVVNGTSRNITVKVDPDNQIIEADETNNNATITAYWKGDLDGDNVINLTDLAEFESIYGSRVTDSDYNSIVDFDDDGVIDFVDFVKIVRRYEG